MLRLTHSTFIVALALLLLLFGIRPAAAGTESAQRLVVVGGALTEIVFHLGAGKRVVGVDTTSRWPAAASELPKVGYQRSLAAEGVLSLRPDLVLHNEDAGPPAVLQQIGAAGVSVASIQVEDSIEGLSKKVRRVAALIGREAEGEKLVARLERDMRQLHRQLAGIERRPRVAFLLSVGRGSTMASGRDTAADAAIALSGGVNALSGYSGYKPLNAESMIAAAPDVLLTTERTLQQIGGKEKLMRLPGVAQTPASRAGRIEAMDGLFLLGFGPRTPAALRELASRLHTTDIARADGRLGE